MTCRPPHACMYTGNIPWKAPVPTEMWSRLGSSQDLPHQVWRYLLPPSPHQAAAHTGSRTALISMWMVWCDIASTIVMFYVTILCSATVSSRSIPAIGNVEHSGNRLKIAIQNVAINCFNCHHFRPRLSFNKKLGASVACTPLGKGPHLCTYMHKLFDGGHHCKAGFR